MAERKDKEWVVAKNEIKEILPSSEKACLSLFLKEDKSTLDVTHESKEYDIWVDSPALPAEFNKLLVNSTLQRVAKPLIFDKAYQSHHPAKMASFDYIYNLPLEMTIHDMLKQINISGFKIDAESIRSGKVQVKVHGRPKGEVKLETKLSEIANRDKSGQPIIEFEIDADQIFAGSTIEKMAKQADEKEGAKFIAQETVFKYFEKLKGLDKMISVMITCVKNWKNAEQSKIWLQYLNELESFSCFPIFSSIYMAKQENVQLLFDLLSGLPDKEESKKWVEQEKTSVKFLYDIIKNVFEVEGEQAITIRKYAINSGFYETMLERLHLVTKEPKRFKQEEEE